MGTKDVLDLDLAARQGLEKLGYTQEMTRVRVVELSSCLVQESRDIQADDASVRRRVACSIFFSVSSIRRVVSRSRVHCCCRCSREVTLGSSDVAAGLSQELTCR
jgi:hypothetical protein